MKYRLIQNDRRIQPKTGVYSDWKEQISVDCYFQCVYCAIHEAHWGGIDHYHIDHYKPKSLFKNLTNVITNLFYACPICNRFKSDDWPCEPELNIPSYPNPSIIDYNDILLQNESTLSLEGTCVSARYLILKLYLNRPQLIYERREHKLKNNELELFNQVAELSSKVDDNELKKRAFSIIVAIRNHLAKRDQIRPYKLSEIRRQ